MLRVDDGVPGEAGVVEGAAARARRVVLVLAVPRRALVQEGAMQPRRSPRVVLQDLEAERRLREGGRPQPQPRPRWDGPQVLSRPRHHLVLIGWSVNGVALD